MKKATKKNVAILSCAALAVGAAATCVAPAFAETTKTTDVYLTIDSSAQLSVTAPTEIPYSLTDSGTFTPPDADKTQIINKSTLPVAVKSYTVAVASGNAVTQDAFKDATQKNAWWNTVAPNNGTAISLNSAQTTLSEEWNMAAAGQGVDTLNLTTAGAMKNIDGTIDFNDRQKLSTVTWTFTTQKNA